MRLILHDSQHPDADLLSQRRPCHTPEDAVRVLAELDIHTGDQEVFVVMCLNTKRALLSVEIVTVGILDQCAVHAREVFRCAVLRGASAVIVAHNHPSGDPTPSVEDLRVTRQLIEAGKVLNIPVLDHLIMGGRDPGERLPRFISIRDRGLVDF